MIQDYLFFSSIRTIKRYRSVILFTSMYTNVRYESFFYIRNRNLLWVNTAANIFPFDLEFKWSALVALLYRVASACTLNCEKTERIKGAHEHSRRKYAANIRLLQLHLKTHLHSLTHTFDFAHKKPRSKLEYTMKK